MRFRRHRPQKHDITCQQAVGLVMDYLDDRLPEDDRARLETHLTECPHCTEHLKQIQVTVTAVGHVGDEDLEPQARDDLINLYRRWRDDRAPDRGQ